MPVYDLGYKPYQGPRHGPGHNAVVLMRQGLGRAWASVLVRVAVILSLIPILIVLAGYIVVPMISGGAIRLIGAEKVPEVGLFWTRFQTWLPVLLISIGAGATAIAEDLRSHGLQFYFAKPVTPVQYLLGRLVPLAGLLFVVTLLPILVLILLAASLDPEGFHLPTLGLLFPAAAIAALVAASCATVPVGLSSLSEGRALTIGAWAGLFILPHLVAGVVEALTESGWAYLASIPALLGILGDALFRQPSEGPIEWYYALAVLVALGAGAVFLALRRLRAVEVVS